MRQPLSIANKLLRARNHMENMTRRCLKTCLFLTDFFYSYVKKEPFTIKAESAILFPSAAPVPSSKALNSQIARAVGRCFFWGGAQKKKAVKTVLIARVKDRCD